MNLERIGNLDELKAFFKGLTEIALISNTDIQGKITFVNAYYCELSGFTQEELIGQRHTVHSSGHHPKEFFTDIWDTILSGKIWRGEICNKKKDGDIFWLDTIITPVKDQHGQIKEFVSFSFDITEKQLQQESLRTKANEKSDQVNFLESMRNNASHSIISVDTTGLVTSFNKRAEDLLGYKADEVVGKVTPSIWHLPEEVLARSEEYSEKFNRRVEPGLDTFTCHANAGIYNDLEWTYVTKSGEHVPVLLSITALKNEQGEITGYVGLSNSLSERKKLEQELKESNEYLSLALSGASIGIWDWYLTDNSVKFDRGWAEMLGLDVSKIPMELSTWESRVHPEDIKQCYADIQDYMDGKTAQYENVHRMKHADGHWVYILDKGKFSDWDSEGKPTRFTGTHIDITEHENTKAKLSLFYENSPIGFAFCDLDGNLIDVNERYRELLGYTLEELQELSYWDITPKKYEEQEAIQLELLGRKGKYGPYRKEYRRKDGSLVPVELNGFIVENYDGQKGIWSIVEDITEKVKAEQEVQQQKQISLHNAKLASIGVLAGGVGHEINNPLTIVRGYLDSITRKFKNQKNVSFEEIEKYLKKMDLATLRIANIVNGLRAFSRGDRDESQRFDVAVAIEETISLLREIYEKEEITLSLNLPSGENEFFIEGNRGKFQQVLMNLISNAHDAVLESWNKNINVNLSKANHHLSIIVQDSGIGMSEETMEKIFDPFFTTKDVHQGTGIGLSIAHGIVQDMHGRIEVDSQVGKGTKFTLDFPLCLHDTEVEVTSQVFQNQNKQFTGRVLIVDDEEEIRDLMAEIIKLYGFEVALACNGQEAFDFYLENAHLIDLVISDMKMPKMNGIELLKNIRSQAELNQPKFFFITGGVGSSLEKEQQELLDLFDGIIYKPFDHIEFEKLLLNHFPQNFNAQSA